MSGKIIAVIGLGLLALIGLVVVIFFPGVVGLGPSASALPGSGKSGSGTFFDWAGDNFLSGTGYAGLHFPNGHNFSKGQSVVVSWGDGSVSPQTVLKLGSDDGVYGDSAFLIVDRPKGYPKGPGMVQSA